MRQVLFQLNISIATMSLEKEGDTESNESILHTALVRGGGGPMSPTGAQLAGG